MPTALVTGAAGFIGAALCQRLLGEGWRVVGVDSMNDYYDVNLKEHRLGRLTAHDRFSMLRDRVETSGLLRDLFAAESPQIVVHLAAQAGVRYSIENPRAYLEANVIGTFELLEAARAHPPRHMLLASTSSAYGANLQMPYRETDRADHQMSFYAATKKSTENLAHSYAHLFDLPITMFRFFTVYGPWGRPDMALFKFTKAILEDRHVDVYNHGNLKRDFTYIDDLVEAICRLFDVAPKRPRDTVPEPGDSLSPTAPFRVLNIGNSQPEQLTDFISAIENSLGREAKRNMMDMQPGDMSATWADTTLLRHLTGYTPTTGLSDGIARFVAWYRDYYEV